MVHGGRETRKEMGRGVLPRGKVAAVHTIPDGGTGRIPSGQHAAGREHTGGFRLILSCVEDAFHWRGHGWVMRRRDLRVWIGLLCCINTFIKVWSIFIGVR